MKHTFPIFFLLLFLSLNGYCQEGNDLLTLSIVQEPTTLHKGRIHGFLGYGSNSYTHYFQNNGYRSKIIEEGMASHDNRLNYSLKYGLTNHIQIGLSNAYFSGFEGYQTYSKIYGIGNSYNYTSVKQTKGLEALIVNVGLKLPIKTKKYEFALFPGLRIPIGSQKPEMPTYNMNEIEGGSNSYNVDFTSYEKAITGAYYFEMEGAGKFRLNNKLAFEIAGLYLKPFSEVSTNEWHYIYDGESYEYYDTGLTIYPGEQMNVHLKTLFVPDKKEIMGLQLGMGYFSEFNGYKIKEGIKTKIPYSYILNVFTGLELMVSRNIRFQQLFWYDVAGENSKGAFGLESSFILNFKHK
jgi:hypothetical protein